MPEIREITLRADLANLPRLIDFVTASAIEAGLDEDAVFHCHLAVDEAATNIIEHGYKGREPGYIALSCEIIPDGLKITLTDSGIPFEMASVHDAVTSKDPGDLRVGGFGLTIIRRVMDDVTLARAGNQNILTLIKRKSMASRNVGESVITIGEIRTGIVAVTPEGRLLQDATTRFAAALDEAITGKARAIIVDLSGVIYISSRGLNLLITAWKRQRSEGRDLFISGPTPRIRSVLEMIGFDQVISLVPTLDEALALCGAASEGEGGGCF